MWARALWAVTIFAAFEAENLRKSARRCRTRVFYEFWVCSAQCAGVYGVAAVGAGSVHRFRCAAISVGLEVRLNCIAVKPVLETERGLTGVQNGLNCDAIWPYFRPSRTLAHARRVVHALRNVWNAIFICNTFLPHCRIFVCVRRHPPPVQSHGILQKQAFLDKDLSILNNLLYLCIR